LTILVHSTICNQMTTIVVNLSIGNTSFTPTRDLRLIFYSEKRLETREQQMVFLQDCSTSWWNLKRDSRTFYWNKPFSWLTYGNMSKLRPKTQFVITKIHVSFFCKEDSSMSMISRSFFFGKKYNNFFFKYLRYTMTKIMLNLIFDDLPNLCF